MKFESISRFCLFSAVVVFTPSLPGRTLIAGWDFSQFQASGFPLVDGNLVIQIDSIESDINRTAVLDFSSFGTPSFGSNAAYGASGTDSINRMINTDRRTDPDDVLFGINFDNTVDANALAFASNSSVNVNGKAFRISLNSSGYSDLQVSFAVVSAGDGPSSILWTADGVGVGSSTGFSSSYSAQTLNLAGVNAVNDKENLTLRGELVGGAIGAELKIDNLQIVALSEGGSHSSYWANSDTLGGTVRDTSTGYDNEVGIGRLDDGDWPYAYAFSYVSSDGSWIYFPEGFERNGDYAYVFADGGYWIYGGNAWGWYYSFASGVEDWIENN